MRILLRINVGLKSGKTLKFLDGRLDVMRLSHSRQDDKREFHKRPLL